MGLFHPSLIGRVVIVQVMPYANEEKNEIDDTKISHYVGNLSGYSTSKGTIQAYFAGFGAFFFDPKKTCIEVYYLDFRGEIQGYTGGQVNL